MTPLETGAGMGRPETEAGRRLLASSWKLGPGEPLMLDTILAIETEAAQAARAEVIAEIRAGVEGLDVAYLPLPRRGDHDYGLGHPAFVALQSVLDLLPPTEPK